SSLTPAANHQVRSLQRRYVEQWVDVLLALDEVSGDRVLSREEARVRVHATFGLLNSSPRLPAYPEPGLRAVLGAMAWAALRAE
ncbi:TetR/AcrR family transcriptional regulator, partial [Streptomyces sp. SID10244]|nr:TetR/AcrR family transcriptional regulator [Streptomyces sp. SID10244]